MNHTFIENDICYADEVDPNNLWGRQIPPLVKPLPQLVLQMTISIVVNHGLHLLLQFVHQPRIVGDIITALVLSPSTLNHIHKNLEVLLWPSESLTILETMANLGLLYAMFIQGLHTDLTPIARKSVKRLAFASSLIILPFIIGCASYLVFWLSHKEEERHNENVEVITIYWGTIIAVTSFPTLAPILAKLKLLCSDIGREALSIGLMNDVFSWFLIIFTLAISTSSPNDGHFHILSPSIGCVLFLMLLFVLFSLLVLRRGIARLVGNVSEGENYSNATVQGIMFLVFACGLVTDFFGSHFIFGAFVLGLCIPNGVLASTLIEKMEDCVLGVLMPLYFVVIGTRLDVSTLFLEYKNIWLIVMAVSAKGLSTLASSFILNMPILDGLALGVLLGAKGLLPLVVLNIGLEQGHMTRDSFTTLLIIILVSTILIQPTISLGYKRMRKTNQPYEKRTLEGANPTDELRLITCIHAPRNVPSIINLLEVINITTQTPVSVSVVHLVELVGQASAMLIEHASRDSSSSFSSWGRGSKPMFNRIRSHSDHIISAFQDYEDQHSAATSFIQTLTIVSPIDTMHEDIGSLAEDKQASLIILPFHKQQGVDGNLEETNIEFRGVNQNTMAMSPCSIALLVDRGLRVLPSSLSSPFASHQSHDDITQISMVYVGGPDDREALTFAWRMAGHAFVTLTVIRFLVGENAVDIQPTDHLENNDAGILTILTQNEREKQIDDEFLQAFQERIALDDAIYYVEKVSNNGEETVNLLREMHRDYDLYVVGRSRLVLSPLTTGLAEWSECPELGTLGDVLVTSDFASHSSVLVIQQYSNRVNYDSIL